MQIVNSVNSRPIGKISCDYTRGMFTFQPD